MGLDGKELAPVREQKLVDEVFSREIISERGYFPQ
jgi:hypothetical protein